MSYNQALMAELKMEAASTRKILSRVPMEKSDWKPHEKSMKLGRIANHIAELAGWTGMVLSTDELDFAKGDYKPQQATTTDELVASLDANVSKSMTALENAKDEDFDKMWTMRRGEHVIMTLPKKVVIRSMALSHSYHHRGQLSVFLRLLDVPVPGIYGPTADEM